MATSAGAFPLIGSTNVGESLKYTTRLPPFPFVQHKGAVLEVGYFTKFDTWVVGAEELLIVEIFEYANKPEPLQVIFNLH